MTSTEQTPGPGSLAAAVSGVSYRLAASGPPLYPRPGVCWWCHGQQHPPGWRACPLVYVAAAELSPVRRRLHRRLS